MVKIRCYIALGSNLENPRQQLQLALSSLATAPKIDIVRTSSFYQTTPLGPQDQPDFINAVTQIDTSLSATALLMQLQTIEQQQGRIRKQRWGPRIIDLDLLLYGNMTIETDVLTIPHPGLIHRNFVIEPLLEIAPDLILPNGHRLRDLVAARI